MSRIMRLSYDGWLFEKPGWNLEIQDMNLYEKHFIKEVRKWRGGIVVKLFLRCLVFVGLSVCIVNCTKQTEQTDDQKATTEKDERTTHPKTDKREESIPTAVRLVRQKGKAKYRIFVSELHAGAKKITTVDLLLATPEDGHEVVTILKASQKVGETSQPVPINLEPACRHAFGGDDKALGRIELADKDVLKQIPQCVPENLFGAATDIVSFLNVQKEGFGIGHIQGPGDKHAFDAFKVSWERPPTTLSAKVTCPGGELLYEKQDGDNAVIHWKPKPCELAMIRAVQEKINILLAGTETISLEIHVDTESGALLQGRSLRDDLAMNMWVPYTENTIPSRENWPEGPKQPVNISRELKIEKL